MLGETFECDRRAEYGWRVLFEQVRREGGEKESERERGEKDVHMYSVLIVIVHYTT